MDATPLPGHWERLPYHWGSGSHFTSEAGPHGETVGDRYADAMSERRELRIADGANLYGDDVTGALSRRGMLRDTSANTTPGALVTGRSR